MIFALATTCNFPLRIKRRVHPTLFSCRNICRASESVCKVLNKLLVEDCDAYLP
jgi:hypothetical protein